MYRYRIARLVADPHALRLGLMALTLVLGVIWGSIAPPATPPSA